MTKFLLRCANCAITRVAHFKDEFGEDYARANPGHIHTFDVERCLGYEIDGDEVMDIDTVEDFETAEQAARAGPGIAR